MIKTYTARSFAMSDIPNQKYVTHAAHLAEMQANNNKWQEVVDLKDKTISTLRAHLELAKGRGK